jgi:hypothetical protein
MRYNKALFQVNRTIKQKFKHEKGYEMIIILIIFYDFNKRNETGVQMLSATIDWKKRLPFTLLTMRN